MQDESGQTTTEYILMLAVLVTIFMQFKKKLSAMLNGLMTGVEGKASRALEEEE
jgi:Flp pilus assembly pilin Flp